ncbi:MAG: nickel-dependent lactate racemase [Planctomycetaceae bacterium]|jgi:nickel-dependent lactate racemase|nr:nickel-dependent lactate racemase [Planctomycetaceae bacterium]
MTKIYFPYGRDFLEYDFPVSRFLGVIESSFCDYVPKYSEIELVRGAICNPIGSAALSELSVGKGRVVLIASDHTRPVPSKLIVPQLLGEIRRGNPQAEIIILVATGCHRCPTSVELAEKFGQEIFESEKIVVHDCDKSEFIDLGKLPSGGDLVLNRLAIDADLLISEGFIEPHFFAGFSGGRKSVLPGIAARETVIYNHNATFIADNFARTGVLRRNPIHADMIYAARKAKLAFICNVIINSKKEVIYAVAGDCDAAHAEGCDFLCKNCMADAIPADIVVTSNGGYPLDQNIYQAVKGMTAAEATVKKNGVIIMIAKSNDGHGGCHFHKTFANEKNLNNMLKNFMETPNAKTQVDQWQSQIFARVLKHASVIYISEAPDNIVKDLHMIPAKSIKEALSIAENILKNPNATITAIPDGVSVIVK